MNFHQPPIALNECDREAIHNIAAVQPFGALIRISGDWIITNRSCNCAAMLGLDALPAPGTPLSGIIAPAALHPLQEAVARLSGPDAIERLFGLRLIAGGGLFDCALHAEGDGIAIEFEPHEPGDYADHLALIGPVLSQLEPLREIDRLCDRAAVLVRQMLGYDRVMIYRFHADESGEVIAEDKREDLEPYLGLRYPRADIPQQARDLFRRNRFRVIADVDAEPVAIEPALSFAGAPLDLSMSMLRAHSTMHVQYMKNMGVAASLAIAIVRHGRLWGLISCHHYTPRLPAYSLRTVAEMFSQMFSLILDRILIGQMESLRERGRKLHDQLMLKLADGTSLADSLTTLDDLLTDVIAHDGASVMIDGRYQARGHAPDKEQFLTLAPALGSAPVSTIIATSELANELPDAQGLTDIAAGALIVPVSRSPRDYLVLWRKPLVQTVTWAGDPTKAMAKAGERIEPRGSFAAWTETVEVRSAEWTEAELQIAESVRISLLEVVLRMTDEASRERARAQEQQALLIAELNHRVRNILNLIRSLVSQSQDDALSVSEFAALIGGRISALASAHDNITRENWAPAPLSMLLETELAAYLNHKRSRFDLIGDDVLITPEAYTVIALVMHELVTNSAKYGSLCDSTGRLTVELSRNRFGDLEIQWRERGGPPVKPPTRRGFGSTIIERSIPYELKGNADLRFKLAGLEADFTIPRRFIADRPRNARDATAPDQAGRDDAPAQNIPIPPESLPAHVLIVEDSMIIALDVEDCLKRLGVRSIAVESSVAGAMRAIEAREPDFAIVDFNLGSESSQPVAAALKQRGVRFVLATGYAEMREQMSELGAVGLLRKPYGRSEIEQWLAG